MSLPLLPLSIFIITYNEADRLSKTLAAIHSLTDDLIVVDSGSTDATVAIAKSFGAYVYHHPWEGYGPAKRFGEDACKYPWILNLDADEVVSDSLILELRTLFEHGTPPLSFYRIRIDTVYPKDTKPRPFARDFNPVRLYDKRVGRYSAHRTHDIVLVPKDAIRGQLKGRIHHYSMRSFAHMRHKLMGYFKLQSHVLDLPSIPFLCLRILVDFPFWFFKYLFIKRHITGGLKGIQISFWYAYCRVCRSVIFLIVRLKRLLYGL